MGAGLGAPQLAAARTTQVSWGEEGDTVSTSSSVLSSLGWASLSVNLGTMPLRSVLWLLTPLGGLASFWGLEAKAAGVGGDSAAPYLQLDLR